MTTLLEKDERSQVEEFLKKEMSFLKTWVQKNVSLDAIDYWIKESDPQSRRAGGEGGGVGGGGVVVIGGGTTLTSGIPGRDHYRNSLTANIYDNMLSGKKKKLPSKQREALGQLEESQLFMELLRDIANELDVTELCYKILINVLMLTQSDRGSLFLVRGSTPVDLHLVSKLFDVRQNASIEESIRDEKDVLIIPFGKGIAGTVAQNKKSVKLNDVYLDIRFNKEVDQQTGYRTKSLLCLPILNADDQVLGVAQIINKANDQSFTDKDEEKFRKYLAFAGVGLTNAQLFEMCVTECKQNEMLLSMARGIFVDQMNLDRLVLRIMTDAQGLIQCQRCIFYIVNPIVSAKAKEFLKIFDMHCDKNNVIYRPRPAAVANALTTNYATKVMQSNALQVMDVDQDEGSDHRPKTDASGYLVRNLLSVPILNNEEKVIGVVQIINKANGRSFTEMDLNSVQTFTLYCGLCVHNCQMYEEVSALMARQKVHMETLSYHAIETPEETSKLLKSAILKAGQYKLYNWDFDDTLYDDFESCKIVLRMFLEMEVVKKFSVDYETLCRWTLSVKKNYRPVTYHNWRHGLNVAQTMFTVLYTGEMSQYVSELMRFALIVACLCHDLDHRGTNNAFQSEVEHPLAMLYCTSTLEHHHFDQCIFLLNSEATAIFQALNQDDYKIVLNTIENAILATDLALYFKKKGKFAELVSKKDTDWKDPAKNELLRCMMMTACDVAAICKPWDIQHKTAHLVASEFFEQGDIERARLGKEPIALMDRKRKGELPKMQVGFIDAVCLPIYKLLFQVNPKMEQMYKGCMSNRDRWIQLAEQESKTSGTEEAAAAAAATDSAEGKQEAEGGGGAKGKDGERQKSCCSQS